MLDDEGEDISGGHVCPTGDLHPLSVQQFHPYFRLFHSHYCEVFLKGHIKLVPLGEQPSDCLGPSVEYWDTWQCRRIREFLWSFSSSG